MWCSSASSCSNKPQHVCTAEWVIGSQLPSLKRVTPAGAQKRPRTITADSALPGNHLFEEPSSGRSFLFFLKMHLFILSVMFFPPAPTITALSCWPLGAVQYNHSLLLLAAEQLACNSLGFSFSFKATLMVIFHSVSTTTFSRLVGIFEPGTFQLLAFFCSLGATVMSKILLMLQVH